MWQTASDFLVYLGWVFENTASILRDIFLPIQYIFTFLKQFFSTALATPQVPEEIWSFSPEILAVFDKIPYFSTLIYVSILGIMIAMIVFILKTFLKT